MRTFISLGYNCVPRLFFEKYRLAWHRCSLGTEQMFSYKLDDVCDLLDWKHQKFFHATNLESKGILRGWDVAWHIVRDNFTGMESVHDFPEEISIQEFLAEFKRKVDIFGFMDDIALSDNPVIIRYNVMGERLNSILRLNEIINHMRAGRPYALIVFQNKIALPVPFKVPNLEVFDCPDWQWIYQGEVDNGKWVGPEDVWKHILCKNLQLLL